MSEIDIEDILSLIVSVFIHSVLIFVAYRIGYNDGWREGYLDRKDFEKTVRDTIHAPHPILTDHPCGGDTNDL